MFPGQDQMTTAAWDRIRDRQTLLREQQARFRRQDAEREEAQRQWAARARAPVGYGCPVPRQNF